MKRVLGNWANKKGNFIVKITANNVVLAIFCHGTFAETKGDFVNEIWIWGRPPENFSPGWDIWWGVDRPSYNENDTNGAGGTAKQSSVEEDEKKEKEENPEPNKKCVAEQEAKSAACKYLHLQQHARSINQCNTFALFKAGENQCRARLEARRDAGVANCNMAEAMNVATQCFD